MAIQQIFYFLMWHLFQCEHLTAQDSVFLLDDPKNIANCMSCITFDRYDPDEMKQYLLAKIGDTHRCKSKLSNIMGQWWFQTMPEEEWNAKRKEIITIKEGIHNEKQLNEYIE